MIFFKKKNFFLTGTLIVFDLSTKFKICICTECHSRSNDLNVNESTFHQSFSQSTITHFVTSSTLATTALKGHKSFENPLKYHKLSLYTTFASKHFKKTVKI